MTVKKVILAPSDLISRYLGKDIVDIITAETPEEIVEWREGRAKKNYPYVSGSNFIRKFNEAFGFLWSHEIIKHEIIDKHVVTLNKVTAHIPKKIITRKYLDAQKNPVEETIIIEGQDIVKMQYGSYQAKVWANDGKDHKAGDIMSWGDSLKASATDGLKKSGVEFGFFLDVYGGMEEEAVDPNAPTGQQLGALQLWAGEAMMTEDELAGWVKETSGKDLGDCEQLEIMQLIPKLRDFAREKKRLANS